MGKRIEAVGLIFGELTVTAEAENSTPARRRVQCRCSCGKETSVLLGNITRGHTRSCGHLERASRDLSNKPADVPGSEWFPVLGGKWTLVDAKDAELVRPLALREFKGYAFFDFKKSGADRYAMTGLHRYILGVIDLKKSEGMVDHINGDRMDNRRLNLRVVTLGINSVNRKPAKKRKYKGVQPVKNGKWVAAIGHKGKLIHIGTFLTEDEAAQAYDQKLVELHGPSVRTNFPENFVHPNDSLMTFNLKDRTGAATSTSIFMRDVQ